MELLFQEIKKTCKNCKKEFVITAEEQEMALQKGGKIKREYCRGCLKRWRQGKIKLNKKR